MNRLRVAVSAAFRRKDGRWNFPGFELATLVDDPAFDVIQLDNGPQLDPRDLDGFDGLILAGEALSTAALPVQTRLAIVARFGVGYDKVDVAACTTATATGRRTASGVMVSATLAVVHAATSTLS